jgi:hypothetical protein
MLVAVVSPEFVSGLFSLKENVSVSRYAFSVGMIWGLFIGAGVGGFVCGLSVLLGLIKLDRFQEGGVGFHPGHLHSKLVENQ